MFWFDVQGDKYTAFSKVRSDLQQKLEKAASNFFSGKDGVESFKVEALPILGPMDDGDWFYQEIKWEANINDLDWEDVRFHLSLSLYDETKLFLKQHFDKVRLPLSS